MAGVGGGMSGVGPAQRSMPRLSNCWTLTRTWSHSRCVVEPEEGASSMWLRKTPAYRILDEAPAFTRDWKRL